MSTRGVLYRDVVNGLDCGVDVVVIEHLIVTGARYIRRRLESFYIYFEPGTTLEKIVLESNSPHKDLDWITKLIRDRVDRTQEASIAYGAVVAVYLAAHNNREDVVPLKALLKYYPYVKPILEALTIYVNYGQIVEEYDLNTAYGHI